MNLGWLEDDLPAARDPRGSGPSRVDIFIEGEVDWNTTTRVCAQLQAAPDADELHMEINSQGGLFGAAHDTFVAVANHPARNKTALIRHAESAALLITMAAHRRFAVPAARIMMHVADMQPPDGERWTAAMHRHAAETLAWVDDQAARLFAHRTGTPREVFVAEMQDEVASSLEWCIQHRVIHGIMDI